MKRESGPEVSKGSGKGRWMEKGTKYRRDSLQERQQDYTLSTCSKWWEEPWDDPGKFNWFNMPLREPKTQSI